ncbi:hypothetical protein SAMN05421841_2497 [Chryseobacterium wanjuense]|jgi:hypothetical protein|uniref:Histidine kinase N-terminal 7TM region domain-containing protein n=1 Tax=Chryseobacterium wanjuense TaxID=356305 RepID=A0A1I0RCX8_9FLAO|nr:hypothetical protein [Chryseobacterium wanjuense]SEW38703.1 hypothetical protein SAMN05421841_2497 [Chryseobacterium wanjuense]
MADFQKIVQELMFWSEGIAALISLLYYNRIKNQYWKYFVFYLIFVFVSEAIGKWGDTFMEYNKQAFYNYFVIPIEFIFFYWLYAAKSFGRPKLFVILSFIYLLSFIPSEFIFTYDKVMFSLNYTLGCLILMILVVMEYYKQINSSNILDFDKNRMFYINLGVTLFYIGTLPFWTFFELLKPYREIYNIYFAYFLISAIVMYLLFSISFIWGKQNS